MLERAIPPSRVRIDSILRHDFRTVFYVPMSSGEPQDGAAVQGEGVEEGHDQREYKKSL